MKEPPRSSSRPAFLNSWRGERGGNLEAVVERNWSQLRVDEHADDYHGHHAAREY